MKWKKKARPRNGSYKVVTRFAWLPTLCFNLEYVWLERYTGVMCRAYDGWKLESAFSTTNVHDTSVIEYLQRALTQETYYDSDRLPELFSDPRFQMTTVDIKNAFEETEKHVILTPV